MLVSEICAIGLMQAGMQANQFASMIDHTSHITNFTKYGTGKSLFVLKTQKRPVL